MFVCDSSWLPGLPPLPGSFACFHLLFSPLCFGFLSFLPLLPFSRSVFLMSVSLHLSPLSLSQFLFPPLSVFIYLSVCLCQSLNLSPCVQ